jgi:uncharacterized protein with ParB-like and HNH nuclease domain
MIIVVSFVDGVSISDILSTSQYEIPPFQRDYSWKKDQITEFWSDAKEVFDYNQDTYFFGPIVLISSAQSKIVKIVDGQQRITSFQILICVIRDILSNNGDEHNASELKTFLFPPLRTDRPRLKLNENNNDFFKNVILKEMDPDEKIFEYKTVKSNEKTLYANYKELYGLVKEKFYTSGKKNVAEENQKLFQFVKQILDAFRLYKITVEDEDHAFKLFATLNQRGLDLDMSDLIKNYVFGQSRKDNRDDVQKTWKKVIDNLGDNEKPDDFLRYNWIATYGYVTIQNLYKELSKAIKSDPQIQTYLQNLLSDSMIYNEIINTKIDTDHGYHLNSLFVELRNDSAQPVILNAKKYWRNNQKDVESLSKLCLDVFFRGKTIGGKAPSVVGRCFAECAIIIKGGGNLTDVRNKLRLIDISDDLFKNTIEKTEHSKQISKYILKNIEIKRETIHSSKIISKEITLEHIMPESIENQPGWYVGDDETDSNGKKILDPNRFTSDQHRKLLKRIGNLTLLHKIPNSELKNISFELKKLKYKTGDDINMTRDLANYAHWNEENILLRCEELSGDALAIWKTVLDAKSADSQNV